MKTELQKHLATLAPSISIVTLWEHDPDSRFSELAAPGCAFENEEPEDWEAWQSEIRATAICQGEEITGSAYLGGTWEKAGDDPRVSNPEISGYELQMTREALEELRDGLLVEAVILGDEIARALDWLKAESGRRYDESRGNVVPPQGYAVKTAKGYLATQGREMWFQDTPDGWALYTSEDYARAMLESNYSAIGTAPHEGGEVVPVYA